MNVSSVSRTARPVQTPALRERPAAAAAEAERSELAIVIAVEGERVRLQTAREQVEVFTRDAYRLGERVRLVWSAGRDRPRLIRLAPGGDANSRPPSLAVGPEPSSGPPHPHREQPWRRPPMPPLTEPLLRLAERIRAAGGGGGSLAAQLDALPLRLTDSLASPPTAPTPALETLLNAAATLPGLAGQEALIAEIRRASTAEVAAAEPTGGPAIVWRTLPAVAGGQPTDAYLGARAGGRAPSPYQHGDAVEVEIHLPAAAGEWAIRLQLQQGRLNAFLWPPEGGTAGPTLEALSAALRRAGARIGAVQMPDADPTAPRAPGPLDTWA